MTQDQEKAPAGAKGHYGFIVVCRDTVVVVLEDGSRRDGMEVTAGWESYDSELLLEDSEGAEYRFAVDSEERNEAPWFVASGFLEDHGRP